MRFEGAHYLIRAPGACRPLIGVETNRLNLSTTHKSCSPPGAVSALFGERATD